MTPPRGFGRTATPAKVADASVIAARAFGEPRGNEVELLLGSADLFAPHLLAYELTNVARNKARQSPQDLSAIERGLLGALSLDIRWVDVDHQAVLALALEKGITTYDASYLYVARSLGVPLVTFDAALQAPFSS